MPPRALAENRACLARPSPLSSLCNQSPTHPNDITATVTNFGLSIRPTCLSFYFTPEAIPAPLLLFCPDAVATLYGTVVQKPDCASRSAKSIDAHDAGARSIQKLFQRCVHRDRRSAHLPAALAAS